MFKLAEVLLSIEEDESGTIVTKVVDIRDTRKEELADGYAEEQEKVKTAEAEIERLRLSEKECLRTMRNMVWKSNEVYDVWHLTEQELYTTKATLDQTCQERNELKAEIEQLRDMLGGRRFYTAAATEAIAQERDELRAEVERLKMEA